VCAAAGRRRRVRWRAWCVGRTDHGREAQRPANRANSMLSGQKSTLINSWAHLSIRLRTQNDEE
jgi:hypothetical protein